MNDNIKIMQRLKRDPMRFDVLDLFDSISLSPNISVCVKKNGNT